MLTKLIILSLFGLFATNLFCQTNQTLPAEIVDGDTLAIIMFEEVEISAEMTAAMKREMKRNEKLIRNVRIVMPYAQLAAKKLKQVDEITAGIKDPKAQKAYYKAQEQALIAEYEAELGKLTISQGKLLIKLIDRETGKTSYKIISEYRSNVTALFWQSFARLFGYNLKQGYDPKEDAEIEAVIKLLGYE